jgi:hypothetical protein
MVMAVELSRAEPVLLRSLGVDEKWLQEQITRDPTLLGLGELEIAAREHRQPLGGRIDFLMRDTEATTYYEVEIMLGALDESHIIRTIEYWDIERQRRPSLDHRAVIVAEQITARFFNVLRLLNRAVPMIAVQLNAFRVGDKIALHPIIVLNVAEEVADADVVDQAEQADRPLWERKAPVLLQAVDKLASLLRTANLDPRLTYNRNHLALGTTGYNFCWLNPRKAAGHFHVEIRMRGSTEARDQALSGIVDKGIDASPRQPDVLSFSMTITELEQHLSELNEVLKRAEELSRAT